MSVYFGEVVVRNNDNAKWVVEEYAFVEGKYELMVNKGLLSMSIDNKCNNWFNEPCNKNIIYYLDNIIDILNDKLNYLKNIVFNRSCLMRIYEKEHEDEN